MKMSSEKSYNDMWEKIEINEGLVRNTLSLAKRDLKTARNVFKDGDYDWTLSIAYNAMLQACRALMFSKGYRPKGKYKHVAVIEFMRVNFGNEFADSLLFVLNKTRKKRHIAVYEQIDVISKEEARNSIIWATKLFKKVEKMLIK